MAISCLWSHNLTVSFYSAREPEKKRYNINSFSLEVDEKYDDRGTTTQSTLWDGYNLLPPSFVSSNAQKT